MGRVKDSGTHDQFRCDTVSGELRRVGGRAGHRKHAVVQLDRCRVLADHQRILAHRFLHAHHRQRHGHRSRHRLRHHRQRLRQQLQHRWCGQVRRRQHDLSRQRRFQQQRQLRRDLRLRHHRYYLLGNRRNVADLLSVCPGGAHPISGLRQRHGLRVCGHQLLGRRDRRDIRFCCDGANANGIAVFRRAAGLHGDVQRLHANWHDVPREQHGRQRHQPSRVGHRRHSGRVTAVKRASTRHRNLAVRLLHDDAVVRAVWHQSDAVLPAGTDDVLHGGNIHVYTPGMGEQT